MRQMVVKNLVVGEVAFRFFVWGNNPATDLKVGCQNKECGSAFGYILGTQSQPRPTLHLK